MQSSLDPQPEQSNNASAPEPARKLAFGVYDATAAFNSIKQHSCVCDADTLDLIAVTGPADGELSQKYAEFFASAPALASRVAELEAALKEVSVCFDVYNPNHLEWWSHVDEPAGVIESRVLDGVRELLGGGK